jgi:hypothetical protein
VKAKRKSTSTNSSSNTELYPGGGYLDRTESRNTPVYFLRGPRMLPTKQDIYVSVSQVRRFGLRKGDLVQGQVREPKEGENFLSLVKVETINSLNPDEIQERMYFDDIRALAPNEPLELKIEENEDLQDAFEKISRIHFGQLGIITAPNQIKGLDLMSIVAQKISLSFPEVHILILLIGGTPTTIAEMEAVSNATVITSKIQDHPEEKVSVAELLINHARRLVECGERVVVLIDSFSKLSHSYQRIYLQDLSFELERYCIVGDFQNGGSLTILGILEPRTQINSEDPIYQILDSHRDAIEIDFTKKGSQSFASESQRHNNLEHHYVDLHRIEELQSLRPITFDLSKLIALCTEINRCHESACYFSVAMLLRSILDHVPPIFGVNNFGEVASNYKSTRSFKDSMQHLEFSSRKIADAFLHSQIRKKEALPNQTQVNFANDLDVLLAEIYRILK